jgi:hypothetical protein
MRCISLRKMSTSLGRRDNFSVLRYCAVGSSVGLDGGEEEREQGGAVRSEPDDLVSGVEIDWTGLG